MAEAELKGLTAGSYKRLTFDQLPADSITSTAWQEIISINGPVQLDSLMATIAMSGVAQYEVIADGVTYALSISGTGGTRSFQIIGQGNGNFFPTGGIIPPLLCNESLIIKVKLNSSAYSTYPTGLFSLLEAI